MNKILFLIVTICFGCANSDHENKSTLTDEVKTSEKFSTFYQKFYNDSSFQQQRILKPLKGTIKSWGNNEVKVETWDNNEITVTPKDGFMQIYKNLKTDLIVTDNSAIEKYWIEQSGFIIEKVFKKQSGKWYLYSYDITNL